MYAEDVLVDILFDVSCTKSMCTILINALKGAENEYEEEDIIYSLEIQCEKLEEINAKLSKFAKDSSGLKFP